MLKHVSLLLVGWGAAYCCQAQQQRWPLQATVLANATLLPPGILTRLWAEPLHPGFSLGTAYTYRARGRHELLQTIRLGYFYQRPTQHALQLYTEAGYRYRPRDGRFDVGPRLGGGYLHSIPATDLFRLTNQGQYEQEKGVGRPQFMLSSSLEIGYSPARPARAPLRFSLGYQFWLQGPFARQYVPLLPHTSLHLGISVPLRPAPLPEEPVN